MNQRSNYSPRTPQSRQRPQKSFQWSLLENQTARTILFYILPFLAVNGLIFFLVTAKPSYEIEISSTHDYRTTDVTFTITSHMPLKTVTLTLDSQPVDLVRTDKRSYTTTVTHNGVLEVYMENFNGMVTSGYELVDVLDNETPDITSYSMENGILTMTVSDSQSGINYDSIHGTRSDGTLVEPLSIDKNTGVIVFDMGQERLSVSISDLSGNEYLPSFSIGQTDENGDGVPDSGSPVTLE